MLARRTGIPADLLALDTPGVEDGVRGLAFIDAALRSAAADGRWTAIDPGA